MARLVALSGSPPGVAAGAEAARSTSSRVMAPPGPVPTTAARSTPRSAALLRTTGMAFTDVAVLESVAGAGVDPGATVVVTSCGLHDSPGSPITASNRPTASVAPRAPPGGAGSH